jgi:dihydroneopterin aldolase
LVPHLEPYGKINMDVNITNLNGDVKGCIPYTDITDLIYEESEVNPYTNLINALQNYVISKLLETYPHLIYEFI